MFLCIDRESVGGERGATPPGFYVNFMIGVCDNGDFCDKNIKNLFYLIVKFG